jgi:hypothetical protein
MDLNGNADDINFDKVSASRIVMHRGENRMWRHNTLIPGSSPSAPGTGQ